MNARSCLCYCLGKRVLQSMSIDLNTFVPLRRPRSIARSMNITQGRRSHKIMRLNVLDTADFQMIPHRYYDSFVLAPNGNKMK